MNIITVGGKSWVINLPTGKELEAEAASRRIAELMAGLGLQEIMSYVLTNKYNIAGKMNIKESPIVEIENVISANGSVFRTWRMMTTCRSV